MDERIYFSVKSSTHVISKYLPKQGQHRVNYQWFEPIHRFLFFISGFSENLINIEVNGFEKHPILQISEQSNMWGQSQFLGQRPSSIKGSQPYISTKTATNIPLKYVIRQKLVNDYCKQVLLLNKNVKDKILLGLTGLLNFLKNFHFFAYSLKMSEMQKKL